MQRSWVHNTGVLCLQLVGRGLKQGAEILGTQYCVLCMQLLVALAPTKKGTLISMQMVSAEPTIGKLCSLNISYPIN